MCQVVSWEINPFASDVSATTETISDRPVLSVRYSLDSKLIVVQRSNREVQFGSKKLEKPLVRSQSLTLIVYWVSFGQIVLQYRVCQNQVIAKNHHQI